MSKLSKIKKISKRLRKDLELKYNWKSDKGCFRNTCYDITLELINELRKNDIYAYQNNGFYFGANSEYLPDMSLWDNNEIQEYFNTINAKEPFGFDHWWVVAENNYIIDITADQFHPNEERNFRVIITDITDKNYNT